MSMNFIPGSFNVEGNYYDFAEGIETINVSNSNGYEIIRALGFEAEDGGMSTVDIDLFITRCQSYLRNHLGKPDPARPVVIERSASAQFDALVAQHGNVMGKLGQMFQTPGVPVVEVMRNSGGPTMTYCGRPEGYLQDRIRRILGTVQDAKQTGATHVWAG